MPPMRHNPTRSCVRRYAVGVTTSRLWMMFWEQRSGSREIELHLLDLTRDGVVQISEVLANHDSRTPCILFLCGSGFRPVRCYLADRASIQTSVIC